MVKRKADIEAEKKRPLDIIVFYYRYVIKKLTNMRCTERETERKERREIFIFFSYFLLDHTNTCTNVDTVDILYHFYYWRFNKKWQ